jgi:hypothetical protein
MDQPAERKNDEHIASAKDGIIAHEAFREPQSPKAINNSAAYSRIQCNDVVFGEVARTNI